MSFSGGGGSCKRPRQDLDSDEDLTNSSENEDSDYVERDESEAEDETQFKSKVHALLKKISNTGKGGNEFVVSGQLTLVPYIAVSINEVDKDGAIIRFPMYEEDTEKIIEAFEKSPYGKGTETVLDPSFRNSWQLDPSQFKILNPQWELYMKDVLLPRISKEMDIATPFTASLYKLLLYKTGSFFKVHRDSEKEKGMFATLVVQLPCKYTGGQLLVSHDSKTKTIDYSSSADSNHEYETCYSAFYCDCQHEILPLTSGVRICLIYNLVLSQVDLPVLVAPRMTEIEGQLSSLLKDWETNGGPKKIVYYLSHRYTQKNFSFENLKSSDKTIAKTLLNLSKENDVTVLMGIFEKASNGHYLALYGDPNSEDENGSFERLYHLTNLKFLETQRKEVYDIKSDYGFQVDYEKEVIPNNCFKNQSPCETTSEETGNSGVEVSLFYRGAALVLIPSEKIIGMFMKHYSIDGAAKIFLKEFDEFLANGKDVKTEAKLKRWVSQMLKKGDKNFKKGLLCPMLSAIITLKDVQLLRDFLDRYNPINADTIPLIVSQCEKFGWSTLASQLANMFKSVGNANAALKLLNLIIEGELEIDKKIVCFQLAQVVLDLPKQQTESPFCLPRFPGTGKSLEEKQRELEAERNFLYDFCQTAKRINFNLLEHAKTQSLSVFGPVLIKLSNDTDNTLDSYWIELAKHFLKKMEQIVMKRFMVPNWRFTDYQSCGCQDCSAVNAFLKSDRISLGFKMGSNRRMHIHQKLNPYGNIINHETYRVGNPETLVVTKMSHANTMDDEERKIARGLLPKLKAMISPRKD